MVPSYCYNIASTSPWWYININQLIYSFKILSSVNCSVSNGIFSCTWTDSVLSQVPGMLGKSVAPVLTHLWSSHLFCWSASFERLPQNKDWWQMGAVRPGLKTSLGSWALTQLSLFLFSSAGLTSQVTGQHNECFLNVTWRRCHWLIVPFPIWNSHSE